MNFILVALVLNSSTGNLLSVEQGEPVTAEACLAQMQEGKLERAVDGKIKVYECVREDQLGKIST